MRGLGNMRGLEARKAQEHADKTPMLATKLPWDLEVQGTGGDGSCHPAARWQRELRAGGWVAASRSRCVRAAAQCVAVTAPGLLQLQSGATHPNGSLGVPGTLTPLSGPLCHQRRVPVPARSQGCVTTQPTHTQGSVPAV